MPAPGGGTQVAPAPNFSADGRRAGHVAPVARRRHRRRPRRAGLRRRRAGAAAGGRCHRLSRPRAARGRPGGRPGGDPPAPRPPAVAARPRPHARPRRRGRAPVRAVAPAAAAVLQDRADDFAPEPWGDLFVLQVVAVLLSARSRSASSSPAGARRPAATASASPCASRPTARCPGPGGRRPAGWSRARAARPPRVAGAARDRSPAACRCCGATARSPTAWRPPGRRAVRPRPARASPVGVAATDPEGPGGVEGSAAIDAAARAWP